MKCADGVKETSKYEIFNENDEIDVCQPAMSGQLMPDAGKKWKVSTLWDGIT